MANAKILQPFVLSWEGGYVNDPNDKGGATNKGVTIATWRAQGWDNDGDGDKDVKDLKLMTDDQWYAIFKRNYWDRWLADRITDQSIANALVDWVWSSGKWGIIIPQQLLGVKADGIVGDKTIQAINEHCTKDFFDRLQQRRRTYLSNICYTNGKQNTNQRFLNGWLRRVNAIKYGALVLNGGKVKTF